MEQGKKILVVGAAGMELYINTRSLPRAGERVSDLGGIGYLPGGKGLLVALAASKLGDGVAVCTKLGADSNGQRLYKLLKESGVDTGAVMVDHDHQTMTSVVIREGEGEPGELVYPGAVSYITVDSLNDAFGRSPDAVYLCCDLPSQTMLQTAKMAVLRGIPLIFDLDSGCPEAELENMPEADAVIIADRDVMALTGVMPLGMDSALRASLALSKKVKCRSIVIKQGARGAFVYDNKRYYAIPPVRADKAVSETGAGVAFGAAFASEFLYSGGDIKSSATYAAAAGAIAVTRQGVISSMPASEEICELLNKNR